MGVRLSIARGALGVLLSLFLSHDLASQTVGTATLAASDGAWGDAFGRSVAISGDTLIVGAPGNDQRGEDAGAAYVFVRDAAGRWIQHQKLLSWSPRAHDYFGWSVAIDGDVAIVGAPGDVRIAAEAAIPGAAYVFVRTNGTWVEHTRLQPEGLVPGDAFGWAVAVSGNRLLASAPYRDYYAWEDAGIVWVYQRAGDGWHAEAAFSTPFGSKYVGFSLALDDDRIVIGAPSSPFRDIASPDHEFRYVRQTTGWTGAIAPSAARDGPVDVAHLWSINSMIPDVDGATLVLDSDTVRRISREGVVSTLYRTLSAGTTGPGSTMSSSRSLGIDTLGRVWAALDFWSCPKLCYLLDTHVQRHDADGTSTTLARGLTGITSIVGDGADGVFLAVGCTVQHLSSDGTLAHVAGVASDCRAVDGDNASARLDNHVGRLVLGPDGHVYFPNRESVRRVELPSGHVHTLIDGVCVPSRCIIAIAPDATIWIASTSEGRTTVRQYRGGQPGPLLGDPPTSTPYSRPIDGPPSVAHIGAWPTAATVDASGTLLLASTSISPATSTPSGVSTIVRTMTSDGVVGTRAGGPGTWQATDGHYGYAVAMRNGRAIVGGPREPLHRSSRIRVGMARVDDPSPPWGADATATVVLVNEAEEFSRYGTAVAIVGDEAVALGPANGCTWLARGVCGDDTTGRPEASRVMPIRLFRQLDDGRWEPRAVLPLPAVAPRSGYGSALASTGATLVAGAPESDYRPQEAQPHGDVVGPGRVFVYDLATLDSDGDGMRDDWEERFGLDPTDPADAALDADADGLTNAQEHAAHAHPHNDAAFTRYFAEGATSDFFETDIAVANPGTAPATVNLRFLLRTGALASTALTVPALQSRHVSVSTVTGMARAEFSTTVESDQPVVLDRRMTWPRSDPYGAHAETAVAGPATRWYLAEGATHSGFNLFYLLQNPSPVEALVHVRFLRPSGVPLEKSYALPPASRTNIWVNQEAFSGLGTALASADVSAVIESRDGHPIIVERALYRDVAGQAFGAGHSAAGVTAPATEWFLAEGATGPFLDLFVLIANPGDVDADIEATYLLPDGTTIVVPHRVAAHSRFNIWVDEEDARLADTAVSTIIRSTNGVPLVVERALWWPGPTAATWFEAHASAGATTTATRWAVADGEVDAARHLETYLLVANTSATAAQVKVTLLFEDGALPVSLAFDVGPHSRFNVPVGHYFPAAAGRRFGALVESLGGTPAPLVVERTMYWDASGQFWAAGTNALATRLP